MKTFKIGSGSFSVWHHGSNIYASGCFDTRAEAEKCAEKLTGDHGIACEVAETAAGWNVIGKGGK